MNARLLALSAALLITVVSNAVAEIGFLPSGAADIAGLAPLTAPPQYAVDSDNGALLLLRNNTSWAIARASDGATMASGTFAVAPQRHHQQALGDFDGDGSVDLVIVTTDNGTGGAGEHTVDLRLELIVGPNYINTTELLSYSGTGGLIPPQVQAIDINSDGYPELVLSIPGGKAAQYGNCLIESMTGETICLTNGLVDTLWTLPGFYTTLHTAHTTAEQWLFAVAISAEKVACSDVAPVVTISREATTISNNATLVASFPTCPPPDGVGDYTGGQSMERQCLIQELSPAPTVDFVTISSCEYDVGTPRSICDPFAPGEIATTVVLQRLSDADDHSPVWSQRMHLDNAAPAYHSLMPDHLLILQGDSIVALALDDGSVSQVESDLPDGDQYWWAWLDGRYGDPVLMTSRNDQLIWYAIDMATAIEADDTGAPTLPQSFVLELPYPNPFNGRLTVPVTVVRQIELKATVYDVLGRTVAVLHDGTASAGDWLFTWDASVQSSGLYLLRVEGGGVSAQEKILLLK